MKEIFTRIGHWHQEQCSVFRFESFTCVLFYRYNNKTYRVDDIEWKMKPHDTFDQRGTQISYKEYFQKVKLIGFIIWCLNGS